MKEPSSGRPGLGLSLVMVVTAMVSIQSGAAVAKQMFPIVGPPVTVALRLLIACVLLWIVFRPWRRIPCGVEWRPMLVYGISLGLMNLLFYSSLTRIPLGVGVAVEFCGPLTVSVLTSRRPIDFLWIGLATIGLILLLPLGEISHGVDPIGLLLAASAGVCWGLYIVFGQRSGAAMHGGLAITWGMTIAAGFAIPVLAMNTPVWPAIPNALPFAFAVAVMSSAFPYSLEMFALQRLPARTFSILMSVEPAIAAMSGFFFLHEALSITQWLAVGLVMIASLGSAGSLPQNTPTHETEVPIPE